MSDATTLEREAASTGDLSAAISAAPTTVPAAPAAEPKTGGFEFDGTFQRKIAALALRDTIFAQKTDGLIKPDYFENEVDGAIVATALEFFGTYKKAPDKGSIPTIIKSAIAAKRIRSDLVPQIKGRLKELLTIPVSDRDFAADKVAEFARHKAMENAILESVGALEKGNFDKIQKLMNQALQVGLQDDGDAYDYWAEIDNRTQHRIAVAAGLIKPDGITTGIPELDKHLYHGGWGRKEVSCIMAPAKFGKSMGLGDFAKNASLAGYNVLIGTFEVGARIYADRIDANLSDTAMRVLKDHPFDVQKKIKAAEANAGRMPIHAYGSGQFKPSALRRLLERYHSRGINFDLIVLDYADIMAPDRASGEKRFELEDIYLNIRAIAHEQNAAVLTATQTNRDGAKAITSKATDVGEAFNKVQHVDLMISGNATDAEKATGEARLFFAASRNQEGEFTLRIKQDREKMKFLTKVLGKET